MHACASTPTQHFHGSNLEAFSAGQDMLITRYLTVLSGTLLVVADGKIECERIAGKRKVLYIIAVTNVCTLSFLLHHHYLTPETS